MREPILLAWDIAMIRMLSICLVAAACGTSNTVDSFATFQACWDEHHTTEALDVQKSIVTCCISHPIGTQPMNVVCGATAADCVSYVTANLTGATSTDISTACATYISQRGM